MKEVYKTLFVCSASRANLHLVLDSDVAGRRNIQELAHIQIYQEYTVHGTNMYKRSLSRRKKMLLMSLSLLNA